MVSFGRPVAPRYARRHCPLPARLVSAAMILTVAGCGTTLAPSSSATVSFASAPAPAASPTVTPSPTPTPGPTRTPPPPGFSLARSMIESRANHTATLLQDGRVLIAGGHGYAGQLLASAEIFDPGTGVFSPTGSMGVARAGHIAALLPDGVVLVVGGEDFSATLGTAEIYDPQRGTFSNTGSMVGGAITLSATTLQDGRVFLIAQCLDLVSGNQDILGQHLRLCVQIYNPATGAFIMASAPPQALSPGPPDYTVGLAVTRLLDGRILVTGGLIQDPTLPQRVLRGAWLYNPTSDNWAATGSMLSAREGHVAVTLADGRVLVAQGGGAVQVVGQGPTAGELYDPATGKFTATGSVVHSSRDMASAVRLNDGRVLVAGGDDFEGDTATLGTAEIYDPGTGKFTATQPIGTELARGTTATLLQDGEVLLTGGRAGSNTPLPKAVLYMP